MRAGKHYPNQGRGLEECREASEDALRGLWPMLRDAVRKLGLDVWLAIALLAAVTFDAWRGK